MDGNGDRRHVVLSTRRRDEAPELLRRTFPEVGLVPTAAADPFVFRHSSVGDARLVSSELMMSGAGRMEGAIGDDVVAVGQVVGGRVAAEFARGRIDVSRPFIRPAGRGALQLEDPHLRLIVFDGGAVRSSIDRYQSGGLGRRRLSRSGPVDDDAAAAWRWTAAHIHDTVRDLRAHANPIVAAELFDLGVRTLLACFGEPAGDDGGLDVRGAPSSVRRAVAYLEEHATSAVAVPDVAAAARVSVRSLQSMFRHHLGVSPIEHLHAIRLESARRELQASGAGAEDGTVRRVAERWGFGNSGRFARLYAARFQERPSDTLRRLR